MTATTTAITKEVLETQVKDLNVHAHALDQAYTEQLRSNIEFRKQLFTKNTEIAELQSKVFELAKKVNELTTEVETYKKTTHEDAVVVDIA